MEITFRVGEFVKVKGSGPGIHRGQVGRIVDNQCSKSRPLYHLEFPDGCFGFFEEDEIEDLGKEGVPCAKCIFEGRETALSKPKLTEEGWVQECPNGHKLYLLGWYRAERGELTDLLTGRKEEINE